MQLIDEVVGLTYEVNRLFSRPYRIMFVLYCFRTPEWQSCHQQGLGVDGGTGVSRTLPFS